MTRDRYKIIDNAYPHFITCSVAGWIPIFTCLETIEMILQALDYRRQKDALKLFGYVVLENHIHVIMQSDNLSDMIKKFKMYTAKMLIEKLQKIKATKILHRLSFVKKAHKKESEYQIWEEGSHPQCVFNDEMMRQKLEYIHYNPVRRGYVDNPVHWRASSARNYEGHKGLIEVDIWS